MRPHARLAALADDAERTMRALGAWSEPAPPLVPFQQPFAMDTMPFEHWLQLVLVPQMRAIAADGARLPTRSHLAAHAVREFDGRDDLEPLVAVLRAIDALTPDAGQPDPRAGRRLALGAAFILLTSAWAVVGVWLATQLAPTLGVAAHPAVIQSFTGRVAPGAEFQPLRITVTAVADDAQAIRTTDASFVLIRSMRTMRHGPTAPLDFPMNERPTTAAVLDWLADFGVDEHADAAHAAASDALALVAAAARARTADALHAVAVDAAPGERSDELLRVGPHTSQVVELGLVAVLVVAGALPILIGLLRLARC